MDFLYNLTWTCPIIRFLSLFLVKLGLYFILGPIFGQKCFIVKFIEESWILKKKILTWNLLYVFLIFMLLWDVMNSFKLIACVLLKKIPFYFFITFPFRRNIVEKGQIPSLPIKNLVLYLRKTLYILYTVGSEISCWFWIFYF